MNWRRVLRDGVVFAPLIIVLFCWARAVLEWVWNNWGESVWFRAIGSPAWALNLIADFIVGTTVGTATGLSFPRYPIRIALLLGLARKNGVCPH